MRQPLPVFKELAFLEQATKSGEGSFTPLDLALASWCLRHGGDAETAKAWALANWAVRQGHTCFNLSVRTAPALRELFEALQATPESLRQALENSPLVGRPGSSPLPLILDGDRLYLQRYFAYEQRLAQRLSELLGEPPFPIDPGALLSVLPNTQGAAKDGEEATDWQAVAVFVALRHRLSVISGGPGTGKTHTIGLLLRCLTKENPPPLVALAAPTGKAAKRIAEALQKGLEEDPCLKGLQGPVPTETYTLQRLLGFGWSSMPKHNALNPLPHDVVIVDEASMVDLAMMAKLFDALASHARIVLVGDPYQLPSVQNGSVLGDLCAIAGVNAFSQAQLRAAGALLKKDAGQHGPLFALSDHVVTLKRNWRQGEGGLYSLAAAVKAGDSDDCFKENRNNVTLKLACIEDEGKALENLVSTAVDRACEYYKKIFQAKEAEEALGRLEGVRLLTVVRGGPFGSLALNRRVEERLFEHFGNGQKAPAWYQGRPVIITENSYRLRLFNGDVGIAWRNGGVLKVWFRSESGLKGLLPSALPAHETVYAMTVHKSQGSEFQAVILLLPKSDNPLLRRELIYTAITRAKERLAVFGTKKAFLTAIKSRVERFSGLSDRIAHAFDPAANL
jgi:exodeoxyribonuclease V alpha subunit